MSAVMRTPSSRSSLASFGESSSAAWSDEFRCGISTSSLGGGGATSSIDLSNSSNNNYVALERSLRSSVTTALAPQPRKCNNLSDFTIDKLKYDSLGLHGREKELELLKKTLMTMTTTKNKNNYNATTEASFETKPQLVLISGYSGTGKTSLAVHALQKPTERMAGIFVRGKFDVTLRRQPYSGIIAACAEICGAIRTFQHPTAATSSSSVVRQQFGSRIRTELGSELALMIQVIPNLAELVDWEEDPPSTALTSTEERPIIEHNNNNNTYNNGSGMSSADSKNRFQFAFLRFIRAVSCQFVPLVMVLDDLQWADAASLDLLEFLLSDPNTSKLVLVGIYRSNEVVERTHILHRTMEELKEKSNDGHFIIRHIEIGNLTFPHVHGIIQELLGVDNNSSQTLGLSEVCLKKTHGNAFFLLQFLAMLKERRLIQFNYGTLSWNWDDKEIESTTSASDNVVNLLQVKMSNLSKDLTDLLKFAACLGSTFDVSTLKVVWEKSMVLTPEGEEQALLANLSKLKEDGYIVERAGSQSCTCLQQLYSWNHDNIQEAALSLVPECDRGAFAANVGRILLSHLDEKDLDCAIFVVANLLNEGDEALVDADNGKARMELARLNYEASRKALSFSAFESAADYAAKGIRVLPPNAWWDHYEFTRKIYSIGARAEGAVGNTETMEQYCKEVLLQDRPLEDKLEVYHTWVDSLTNRDLLLEARDLLLDILKKFKCHFPKNPVLIGLGIVSNLVKVKATLKSINASKLPVLKDTTRIELLKLLDKLATVLYMSFDQRMPLAVFRSLNWTMKYGYCDYSSVALATTGMMLTGILNDLPAGTLYGEQAVALMDRSKSQTTAARTIMIVYGFLFPWTQPLRNLLKPLLRGYDIGLQTG
jgi:predicted ATPase